MKIRTDFVTNSSSSSFVTFKIDEASNKYKFAELDLFLEELREKYQENPLGIWIEYSDGIQIRIHCPRLAAYYIGNEFKNRDEMQKSFRKEKRIRGEAPPSLEVAIATIFGPDGRDGVYSDSVLIDENGHLSDTINTYLSEAEAIRLKCLVDSLNYKTKGVKDYTD